jgi:hypothetical protein
MAAAGFGHIERGCFAWGNVLQKEFAGENAVEMNHGKR